MSSSEMVSAAIPFISVGRTWRHFAIRRIANAALWQMIQWCSGMAVFMAAEQHLNAYRAASPLGCQCDGDGGLCLRCRGLPTPTTAAGGGGGVEPLRARWGHAAPPATHAPGLTPSGERGDALHTAHATTGTAVVTMLAHSIFSRWAALRMWPCGYFPKHGDAHVHHYGTGGRVEQRAGGRRTRVRLVHNYRTNDAAQPSVPALPHTHTCLEPISPLACYLYLLCTRNSCMPAARRYPHRAHAWVVPPHCPSTPFPPPAYRAYTPPPVTPVPAHLWWLFAPPPAQHPHPRTTLVVTQHLPHWVACPPPPPPPSVVVAIL